MEDLREDIKNELLKRIDNAIEEKSGCEKVHSTIRAFSEFLSALDIEANMPGIKK